jgi:pyridoxal phosphate enzyme (YggS family)
VADTTTPLDLARFRARLAAVQARVGELAQGRAPPRIVVVTKTLSPADCRALRDAGIGPLAENRAQDLVRKVEPGADREGWHFIGHVQRNKVDLVIPRIGVLHSLDSERLARSVDDFVEGHLAAPFPALVQVNISGERSKGGLAPGESRERIPEWIEELRSLRIIGLMTMAPEGDPSAARSVFRGLRELRDEIRAALPDRSAERFEELSMGMSDDHEVATEEGATLLRLGRILYS